eukprot:TRINITY_DN7087_c0_g1_i1.p1 TRINITY_DN7087_c0_g1~~TRINITY_DN7087_c0_g1_i1.p1  ORF type:complete len:380 (-),score=94.50 TRINITY_DN7087_c0_g1_i1:438-1538(-)
MSELGVSQNAFAPSQQDTRAYLPFHRSEKYSPTLTVDFRKLELRSLHNYVKYYSIPVREDSTRNELAVAVGRHFEALRVSEMGVIGALLQKCSADCKAAKASSQESTDGSGGTSDEAGSHETDSAEHAVASQPGSAVKKAHKGAKATRKTSGVAKREEAAVIERTRRRSAQAVTAVTANGGRGMRARVGEQVACLMDADAATESEQAMILARVDKYHADSEEYECTDEDDKDNTFVIHAQNVIRLADNSKGLDKGSECLAVFPDTTSFYRATVHRVNRHSAAASAAHWQAASNERGALEIVVKFQDDEDETGATPARRVASRHVIPVPPQWRRNDEEAHDDTDNDVVSEFNDVASSQHRRAKRAKQ